MADAGAGGADGQEDEDVEVVMTVGELDYVVVTLRDFLHRSGALRVVAVVPGPAVVDVGRFLPVEVTRDDRVVQIAHGQTLIAVPLPLPEVRQLPPFDVKPDTGEVHSTIGGLEHYAEAVRALAHALGDDAIAMASFETTTPDLPLSISARGDEPIVLAIGEDDYEMEADWP